MKNHVVMTITIYKDDEDIPSGKTKPLIRKFAEMIEELGYHARIDSRQVMKDSVYIFTIPPNLDLDIKPSGQVGALEGTIYQQPDYKVVQNDPRL